MSDAFRLVLSMSISGSALILLLMLLKPFFKERFSKAWQYYIWIVVLIRLLLPFTPEFGLTNDLFHTKAVQNVILPKSNSSANTEVGNSASDNSVTHPQEDQYQTAPSKTSPVQKSNSQNPWEIACFLWVTGIILLLSYKIIQYIHFTSLIRNSSEPVADQRILKLFHKVKNELGLKRGPRLFYSTKVASPMLIGLVKPTIYLTDAAMRMGDNNLSYVLRHELMHYKRYDLYYKWSCELTLTIHWFNPFAYLMGRQINSQCEVSCDEALTKNLNQEEKLVYGNMLLNAAADNVSFRSRVLSTTLYEDKKSLKERILSIMTSKRKSKRTIVVSIITAILLCTAAFLLGAYTAKNTGKAAEDITTDTTQNNQASDNSVSDTLPAGSDNAGGTVGSAAGTDSTTDNSTDASASDNSTADNTAASADNTDQASAGSDSSSEASDTTSKDNGATVTASPAETEADSIVYKDDKYGFEITLPASWKGFTTGQEDWQGIALEGEHQGEVIEAGTKLIIRHPEWTVDNPRQDIPIMVFTPEQWKLVENEEIAVSAAPIGPTKLSSNSDYVFALPARYNYAFQTGYEEVDQIIQDNFFK